MGERNIVLVTALVFLAAFWAQWPKAVTVTLSGDSLKALLKPVSSDEHRVCLQV